jgi:hypothetical protein
MGNKMRNDNLMIYIDYYMAFFISYPLSALGHDISPRAKGMIFE